MRIAAKISPFKFDPVGERGEGEENERGKGEGRGGE